MRSMRQRLADVVVIGLIILALLGAAAPDYYRYRDIRASRDVLHQLNEAEQEYQAANPHLGYACTLEDLADAGLLTPALSEGSTDSYIIHLNCRERRRLGPHASYWLYLAPKHTDRPYLCSDESGLVASDRWSLNACHNALQAQRSPAP